MKNSFVIFTVLLFFTACKKNNTGSSGNGLYPLATGNTWIYVDSFFNENGNFYGLDTFTLKTTAGITFNNQFFTPITDQFDDSIFIIHCTNAEVFMLQNKTSVLIYSKPNTNTPPILVNSYFGDTLSCKIFTLPVATTNYPSYKVLITYDNGQRTGYKQQELYFTPGIGIIKGRDYRKNRTGNFYAYDSYRLAAYSLY